MAIQADRFAVSARCSDGAEGVRERDRVHTYCIFHAATVLFWYFLLAPGLDHSDNSLRHGHPWGSVVDWRTALRSSPPSGNGTGGGGWPKMTASLAKKSTVRREALAASIRWLEAADDSIEGGRVHEYCIFHIALALFWDFLFA